MIHVFRHATAAVVTCAMALPAVAAPVMGLDGGSIPAALAPDLRLVPIECDDPPAPPEPEEPEPEPEPEPDGNVSFQSFGQAALNDGPERLYLACHGDGPGYEAPGLADAVEARVEIGIEHCEAYRDVWRVDCLSDELQRVAQALPNDPRSRRAKAEIRAAAERLRRLAEQNADPAQPAVRRATNVGGVRRATSRRITAVAPDRVVATNLAADRIVAELSTTLLRSASGAGARDFTRVAAAVNSTRVLLRSS